MFLKNNLFFSLILVFWICCQNAMAAVQCSVVQEDEKKTPYKGESVQGLQIQKKALSTLNKLYPQLNILEKVFKGEIRTCASCSEKYVSCSSDDDSDD